MADSIYNEILQIQVHVHIPEALGVNIHKSDIYTVYILEKWKYKRTGYVHKH